EIDIVLKEYVAKCLDEGCLDYGLATLIYYEGLLQNGEYVKSLREQYPVLLVDNLEEMAPVATELVTKLLKGAKGAVLCYCIDGGYSRFYGADPEYALSKVDPLCSRIKLSHSYTCSKSMSNFADLFSASIMEAETSIPVIPGDIDVEWEID